MRIDTGRVQMALAFASECHGTANQMRATATPYIVHPYAVMGIVQRYADDYGDRLEDALCTAALHDVVEDTNVSILEIRERFGNSVGDGVEALTKDDTIADKIERLSDSLDRARRVGPWVVGIKAADRIENFGLATIPLSWDRAKRLHYVLREAPLILYRCRQAGMRETADRLEHAMHVYEQYIPPV